MRPFTSGAVTLTWTFRNVPALETDGGDGMAQAGSMMKIGGLYVLVSSGNLTENYVTTTNFSSFTARTAPFPIGVYRSNDPVVAFGKAFVGHAGGIAYTEDGLSWTAGLTGDWVLFFDGVRLIAKGSAGVKHSTDGISWTTVSGTAHLYSPWGIAV